MPSPGRRRPGPASRTNTAASRAPAAVFRCSYCGRVCSTKADLASHKRDEHADQITHLTESSVAGASAAVQEDFAVPENPQLPGRRRGRPRKDSPDPDPEPDPDPDDSESGDDEENDPPPPPSPPKRGKRQGRNKSPLPIGRKKRVKGTDGVERTEYPRGERTSGG